jgi:hypothetical protein
MHFAYSLRDIKSRVSYTDAAIRKGAKADPNSALSMQSESWEDNSSIDIRAARSVRPLKAEYR